MSRLNQSALLEDENGRQERDERLLVLLKRLGIDTFPAHETLALPLERIVVPGAALVRPSPRLVRSIQQVGVLQNPSVVLLTGAGMCDERATFEVIFGRRRLLAAHLAGRLVIKCEVYESGTPQLSSLLALIENEQRSTAWIKEVSDLRRLIDEQVGMTPDDLVAFGFDRGSLTERLKMAQLPVPLLTHLLAGKMTQVTARKLTRLNGSQLRCLEQAVCAGEEVTEELVKSTLRLQVNAGLVPLQDVLEASMATHPVLAVGSDLHGRSDASSPSLQQVLVLLQSFERTLVPSTTTQQFRLLVKALLQEGQVVARTAAFTVKTAEEAAYV